MASVFQTAFYAINSTGIFLILPLSLYTECLENKPADEQTRKPLLLTTICGSMCIAWRLKCFHVCLHRPLFLLQHFFGMSFVSQNTYSSKKKPSFIAPHKTWPFAAYIQNLSHTMTVWGKGESSTGYLIFGWHVFRFSYEPRVQRVQPSGLLLLRIP